MMSQENRIASALSTLGTQRRVHVPAEILESVGWPKKPSPVHLIAELVDTGCIRIHLHDEALKSKIEALRQELQAFGGPDLHEKLAVLADRYREAKLYLSAHEQSIALDKIIAVHLGISMTGNRDIYLEARGSILDIMSLEYRNKRLQLSRAETSI